jgi:hypothetical protein
MIALAVTPDVLADEADLPPLDFARYAPAPVVIDHAPAPSAGASLHAIAFACWRAGWLVLWLLVRFGVTAGWIHFRIAFRRRCASAARSLTALYAVAGMGWGAAGTLAVFLFWR